MQQVNKIANPGVPSTDWLNAKAAELGFDLCGILPAQELAPPEHFANWLELGFAGEMRYLHDPRRADPATLMPEACSVIVCAVNYNPAAPYSTEAAAEASQDRRPRGWISRYAWGEDYHLVVGERLERLVAALREHYGAPDGTSDRALGGSPAGATGLQSFAARAYVDTGPVSERMAAKLAGLGWLGKNTCLINRELGSWLFLGVILTSLDLAASADPARSLAPDLCGNCRLCLDACPTGALVEPYVLDARRCISYLTIELRGAIPQEFRAGMGWQVFGCDICQDVCPWNRSAPAASLPGLASRSHSGLGGRSFSSDNRPGSIEGALAPEENIATQPIRLEAPELLWLLGLSEQEFREAFRKSAVRRAKWRGLVRNACVAAGNALRRSRMDTAGRAELKLRLEQWAAADDAIIAEHARWALAQDHQKDSAAPQPHCPVASSPVASSEVPLCRPER